VGAIHLAALTLQVTCETCNPEEKETEMKKLMIAGAALLFTLTITPLNASAQVGPPGGTIWADGIAFQTVATPSMLPNKGPKDGIFAFNGLEGQASVAEAKPGDRDYNGGRWQVYVLTFTEEGLAAHDADQDGVADFQLTDWETVQQHINLGHFTMSMGPSFVCPMIRK
jgi:hypothetical protein